MSLRQSQADRNAERVCNHKFAFATGRTTLASQPVPSPTWCQILWSGDSGRSGVWSTAFFTYLAAMESRAPAK
ncbi:MAG: hypothetical protein SCJ97_11475 [Bacillota bacterium]|nr:hypothetical protein [Bacillota bacterium]